MTPAERLLKQNIDRLQRATKDLTKAFQEQTRMTASVLESITKVMTEMTSTRK